MMGGTLAVESTPGVGSKFSFTIIFDTIDVFDEETSEKIVFNELEKPTFEGEVLLCEDNLMNQQVISEHLSKVGLKTVIADNGKIGLEMVESRMKKKEKQFDLIFMDMHMPVMDGLGASAKIVELDTGVPIVAMTANIMADDMEIYKKSGMNDCVGKPFTSQALWKCLMKYFTPVEWHTVDEKQIAQMEDRIRQKLINNFVKEGRNKYSEIAGAINVGDIKRAHRLAHTLKGNAGQIGKTLLQQAAAEVELHLKDEKNLVTPQQLNTLETELTAVIAELTPLYNELFQPGPDAQTEPLGVEAALELLDKLRPMLERGNPECRNLIGNLRAIPGSEELIRQMEDLDFTLAAASLAELKGKLQAKAP
jgi:CheY-like chemotaxis protein